MGAEVGSVPRGSGLWGPPGAGRGDLHSRSGRTSHLPGNALSMGERPPEVAPARERSSNAMNLTLTAQDQCPAQAQ
jgi:hypothetical protein